MTQSQHHLVLFSILKFSIYIYLALPWPSAELERKKVAMVSTSDKEDSLRYIILTVLRDIRFEGISFQKEETFHRESTRLTSYEKGIRGKSRVSVAKI
jgi:hypothetical protein